MNGYATRAVIVGRSPLRTRDLSLVLRHFVPEITSTAMFRNFGSRKGLCVLCLLNSQTDDCGCIWRKRQPVYFLRREPACVGGIPRGTQVSGESFAKEVDQHIVIQGALLIFRVRHHTIEHTQQICCAYPQAGFFQCFPLGSMTHSFPKLKHAAGDGPLAKQRRFASFDQDHSAILDDDGPNPDQRAVWILALHRLSTISEERKTAGPGPSRGKRRLVRQTS